MNWIKRLFCRHKYKPYKDYYETRKDGHKYIKHAWKCPLCGKIKY